MSSMRPIALRPAQTIVSNFEIIGEIKENIKLQGVFFRLYFTVINIFDRV